MIAAKKKATAKKKAAASRAPRAKKKAVAKKKTTAKKPSSRMAWRAERAKENAARKAAKDKPPNIIWQPLPGSQSLAVTCPCNHILLAGARGGGKTDAQLMMFRKNVGIGYGQHWRGIIFDREYKQLSDLIAKSKRWFRGLGDGAKFLSGNSQLKWVWPTGEELWFRTIKNEDDYYNYHGFDSPFLGHNELTKSPNLDMYDMLMSINRSSFVPELHSPDKDNPLPEIPLVVVSTTNPYGPGHNAVKQRFIDAAPPGVVVPISQEVFNPRTQKKEVVTKTQVHIFSSYRENRNLAPEYVLELERLKDPNKRKAWLYGDWEITAGGLLDDVWSSEYNIVPPFDIPHSWPIYRAFDWGSSKPFSVGWWAESDGSDVMVGGGKWRSTIKGDLFRCGEYYGWTGKDNEGLRLLNTQIAKGIIERELQYGWYGRVTPGPADNSINDIVNGTSVALDMGKPVKINGKMYNGPLFSQSIKAPGSRIQGWEKLRVAIYNAQPDEITGQRESAGLFVFNHCKDGFIRTVPSIPRDPKNLDDALTLAEDHCFTASTALYANGKLTTLGELAEHATSGHVMTRDGWLPYRNARVTRRNAKVVLVTFSDGSHVRCTPDHKFMVKGGTWVEARYAKGYTLSTVNAERIQLWHDQNRPSLSVTPSKSLRGPDTTSVASTSSARGSDYTALCGSVTKALSLKGFTSTIRTMIEAIIQYATCSVYRGPSTCHTMGTTLPQSVGKNVTSISRKGKTRHANGMEAKRVGLGIKSITRSIPSRLYLMRMWTGLAVFAERFFAVLHGKRSAPIAASLRTDGQAASITNSETAKCVVQNTPLISIRKKLVVQDVVEVDGQSDVYCLSVPTLGHFALANGAIVANCADETRYMILSTGSRFGSGTTRGTAN